MDLSAPEAPNSLKLVSIQTQIIRPHSRLQMVLKKFKVWVGVLIALFLFAEYKSKGLSRILKNIILIA